MTSLLRALVAVPMPSARSTTTTSWPVHASSRATARPITPAPTTSASTRSIAALQAGAFVHAQVQVHALHRGARRALAEIVLARDQDALLRIGEHEEVDAVGAVAALHVEEV